MLMERWATENILVQGRWATVASAREYLKKGEVALLRLRVAGDKEIWKTLALWSALGASVLGLGRKSVEKAPLADRKVETSSSSNQGSSSSSHESDNS